VDEAIVAARIDEPEPERRLVECHQCSAGDVAGPAAGRKVIGYRLEMVALVHGAEQALCAHVQDIRVVHGKMDRGLPIPAVRPLAQLVLRRDEGPLARGFVDPLVVAKLRSRVYRIVVTGVDLYLHAVTAGE